MGRQQGSQAKTGTKCHLRLHKILEEMGFQVLDEALFGRYSLDCYVPEIHIGFEADGKHWHSKKHDSERDEWLFEKFSLPICRLKDSILIPISKESLVKEMIQEFINAQRIDDNRKAFAICEFEPVGRELKSFEAPWKGTKRTSKQREQMSDSAKIRIIEYPESGFIKGRISPMKGKSQTQDARNLISKSGKEGYQNGRISWNEGLTKEIDDRINKSGFKKGHKPWNKGLTKETDIRVRKSSESLKRYISEYIKNKSEDGDEFSNL